MTENAVEEWDAVVDAAAVALELDVDAEVLLAVEAKESLTVRVETPGLASRPRRSAVEAEREIGETSRMMLRLRVMRPTTPLLRRLHRTQKPLKIKKRLRKRSL